MLVWYTEQVLLVEGEEQKMRWCPEGALRISYRTALFWHPCARLPALTPPKPTQTKEQPRPTEFSGCQLLSQGQHTEGGSGPCFFGNRTTVSNHNFRTLTFKLFSVVSKVSSEEQGTRRLIGAGDRWQSSFASGSRHSLPSASSVHSCLFRLFVV